MRPASNRPGGFDGYVDLCYNEPMKLRDGNPRFLVLAALAFALPGAAFGQRSFEPGVLSPQSVQMDVVPFEMQNGLVVVKALIGDGLVTPAILDTGLPICILTPAFAAKRAFKPVGPRDVPVLDRNLSVLGLPVQAVRINRMVVTSAATGVLDLYAQLSAAPPADAPPVWIGNSALATMSITIDPESQQITMRPAGAPLPVGATIVPFEFKDGRIWVSVKVNGKKDFSALLDTGSVGTLLPASVAKALTLTPAATYPITHPDGKEGKVCAVDLTDIEMAGLKVTDVQAIYISQGSKDGFDTDLGIIGNDVLMRYRVTIDYAQKKIAFVKIATKPAATAASTTSAAGTAGVGVPSPLSQTPPRLSPAGRPAPIAPSSPSKGG
jgi:predicted aspartyl protease